jgi:hypothetical protein
MSPLEETIAKAVEQRADRIVETLYAKYEGRPGANKAAPSRAVPIWLAS